MTSRSNAPVPADTGEPANKAPGQPPAPPPVATRSDDTAATPHADGSRVVKPDSDKATGQAPPEDIDGGPASPK